MEEKEGGSGLAKHSTYTDSVKKHNQSQMVKERENLPGFVSPGFIRTRVD